MLGEGGRCNGWAVLSGASQPPPRWGRGVGSRLGTCLPYMMASVKVGWLSGVCQKRAVRACSRCFRKTEGWLAAGVCRCGVCVGVFHAGVCHAGIGVWAFCVVGWCAVAVCAG